MKRILSIIAVASALLFISYSCTEDEVIRPEKSLNVNLTEYYVSIDQAEHDLCSFLKDMAAGTKSLSELEISERLTITTTSTKAGEEPIVYYVFNFKNDEGYAMMAGDSRVPSPLCFVEQGRYCERNQSEDLGEFIMDELMGMYRVARLLPDSLKYECYSLDHIPFTKADTFYPVDTVYKDGKYYVYYNWVLDGTPCGTCLSTEWQQESPFNLLCPLYYDSVHHSYRTSLAGCTPIAVAQIMSYWQVDPPSPYSSLNWNYMAAIQNAGSSPTDYVAWNMVQTLIRRLGDEENLDADYGASTPASQYNSPRTFINFGYSSGGTIQSYNYLTLRSSLSSGPALGVGYRYETVADSTYLKGHTWVYDRYVHRKRPLVVYDNSWHIITSQMLGSGLLHINWGWGGAYNGYFANSRFNRSEHMDDPLDPYIESTDTTRYYHYYLQMNTGIMP